MSSVYILPRNSTSYNLRGFSHGLMLPHVKSSHRHVIYWRVFNINIDTVTYIDIVNVYFRFSLASVCSFCSYSLYCHCVWQWWWIQKLLTYLFSCNVNLCYIYQLQHCTGPLLTMYSSYAFHYRAMEYAVDSQNLNLSAIRTIRVLRPLRAINRIPSKQSRVSVIETIYGMYIFPLLFHPVCLFQCHATDDRRRQFTVSVDLK